MTKTELTEAVDVCINTTRDALQTVFDALNQGQQKKLLNDENVKNLLDRFDVEYGGG